jgi:hypothetical protein
MKGHVVNENFDQSLEAGGQWSAVRAVSTSHEKLPLGYGIRTVEVSRFIRHLEGWSHEKEPQAPQKRCNQEEKPRLEIRKK